MYELYVENCRSQYGEAYSSVSSGVYRKYSLSISIWDSTILKKIDVQNVKNSNSRVQPTKRRTSLRLSNIWKDTGKLRLPRLMTRNAQTTKKHSDQSPLTCNPFFRYHRQMLVWCRPYYDRKLCCYNVTIYEQGQPHNAHCYLWSEVDGRRGSNEIGSCLLQYLQSLPQSVQEISMFSDTCGGQNATKISWLYYFMQFTQVTIWLR